MDADVGFRCPFCHVTLRRNMAESMLRMLRCHGVNSIECGTCGQVVAARRSGRVPGRLQAVRRFMHPNCSDAIELLEPDFHTAYHHHMATPQRLVTILILLAGCEQSPATVPQTPPEATEQNQPTVEPITPPTLPDATSVVEG